MSDTNLAYAVIGVRIPMAHLFTAGARHMQCWNHGIMEGKCCSECGRRLDEKFEQVPTDVMTKASEHYGVGPTPLWDMMAEKRDELHNPAPLGWWRTEYSHKDLTDRDAKVILGLELVKTPFKGFDDYPYKGVGISTLLEMSRAIEKQLPHFSITDKTQLFVFSYA
jgi:hypothetical protein